MAGNALGRCSLFGNSLKGGIVVETKVAGMDDMIGAGGLGKLVQGVEVACDSFTLASRRDRGRTLIHRNRTSNVSYAKDPHRPRLNHSTLVREEGGGSRWDGGAIWHVARTGELARLPEPLVISKEYSPVTHVPRFGRHLQDLEARRLQFQHPG